MPPIEPVRLEGTSARVFEDAASKGSHLPPGEVVTAREVTARRYLSGRRNDWAFRSLLLAGFVTLFAMCGKAAIQPDTTEEQLWTLIYVVFGGSLLLSAVLWQVRRPRREAELGPLDEPRRGFRVEPDALVIEQPNAPARRLKYADLRTCKVSGHRVPKSRNWHLIALAVDDGAGPVELHREWLEKDRVLYALAHHLMQAGVIAVDEPGFAD